MSLFKVLNPNGSEPDLQQIAVTEEWAKGLIYCDMEGFVIDPDGCIALTDECGGVRYPPVDRFRVTFPDRDAEIAKLRALCGEAAVQLDKSLDLAGLFYQYERSEHICSVIGDEALAAKLRAASEGK